VRNKKKNEKKCAAPKPRGRRVADKAERIRRLPSTKTSSHRSFGFSILQKQNRPSKRAKIRRVQAVDEARADYGEIISYSARGLFIADVLPTSAICRPVEACETAATRIAEDEKPFQRSFCSFFFRAERKRRSFPRCAGKGQSLSHASRASSLFTKEPLTHADCLTPMCSRPRRYVDLSKLARQQRHKSPNIKNRFSVLFAPFSFVLKEKGDRSRDAR